MKTIKRVCKECGKIYYITKLTRWIEFDIDFCKACQERKQDERSESKTQKR